MIPDFNDQGNLPQGIYESNLSEIEKRFAYNKPRQVLFRKLKLLVKDLRMAGCLTLYLNGSYITNKEEPDDYDACWETEGVTSSISPILRDIRKFKRERKQKYGGDIFYRIPELGIDHLQFFQQDSRTGELKGIIRINLETGK